MSLSTEAGCEQADALDSVVGVTVKHLKAVDGSVDEPFKHSWGVAGAWWDVEVKI